jgi:hypothetical protein
MHRIICIFSRFFFFYWTAAGASCLINLISQSKAKACLAPPGPDPSPAFTNLSNKCIWLAGKDWLSKMIIRDKPNTGPGYHIYSLLQSDVDIPFCADMTQSFHLWGLNIWIYDRCCSFQQSKNALSSVLCVT